MSPIDSNSILLDQISTLSSHLILKKSKHGTTSHGCGVNLVVTGQQHMPPTMSMTTSQLTHLHLDTTPTNTTMVVSIIEVLQGFNVDTILAVAVFADEGEVSVVEGEVTMTIATTTTKAIATSITTATPLLPATIILVPKLLPNPTTTTATLANLLLVLSKQVSKTLILFGIFFAIVDVHMKRQPIFSSSTTKILLTIAVSFLQEFSLLPFKPSLLESTLLGRSIINKSIPS
jgi:hypothetical protein